MPSKNPILKLAGETAIYGFTTIFAKVLNFLFLPLYTYLLSPESFGVLTEFLAYIAVLQVLLTLGLETGCFRYANKTEHPQKVFSNALATISIFSITIFLLLAFSSKQSASVLGYSGFDNVVLYTAAILVIDAVLAVPFARLRFLHKSVRFVTFKSIKILCETGFNLLIFLAAPAYIANNPDTILLKFISATPDFTYPLFAIFLSAVVSLIIMLQDILKVGFRITPKLWKQMMLFSLPIMIAGLPGVLNDFADRFLFRFFSPEGHIWRSDLGIFQAGVKIATIMMLFIQMFRYAAEPFFFSNENDRDSGELYAKVMSYFTAFGVLIALGVLFYIDIIQILVGKDFRQGMSILPIMLLAYLILGMNFNVSMWYKLSGKSKYAIWITCTGLVVTLLVNIIFMPHFSYHAAAWAHLASYTVMMVVSLALGNKHYPIPYNWRKITAYIAIGVILYFAITLLPQMNIVIEYTIRTITILLYVYIVIRMEKISLSMLKRGSVKK